MMAVSTVEDREGFSLVSFINDARVRGVLYQILAVILVAGAGYYLFSNASGNLARQNIATGFDYLRLQAGFTISEKLIAYEPTDTYARALLVGVLNTIFVSFMACILCTFLGVIVGILRLSPNPLLARLMLLYVEAMRNVPLLLHLFMWYAVIVFTLPPVKEAYNLLPGVFLSNGGFYVPMLDWSLAHTLVMLAFAIGVVAATFFAGAARRRRERTGEDRLLWPWLALLIFAPPLVIFAIFQPDMTWSIPELGKFRFSGGVRVTAEFSALLIGLTLTTSASVAEIVRSGIQAVGKGQWEAARALGLPRTKIMRMVILPQALRVIVPPLTNTYLSVTKNSSLAIAIGYPDLVMVSNATMNQTGRPLEAIAIFMGIYLLLSLGTSMFMNWYNGRVALKGR